MQNLDLSKYPESISKTILHWLSGNFDEKIKEEIQSLYHDNPDELYECFASKLSFGTAGIRGIMGPGTNRINIYTVRQAAKGLSDYILEQSIENPSVVIGYDNRKNSKLFAEQTARVLAKANIKAYLFKELKTTPFISFCCRYLKCTAAVMITASHNPPQYNGFKAYWSYGGQVLPPHDKGIIDKVNSITELESIALSDTTSPLIEHVGDELDINYIEAIKPLQNISGSADLNILFSNLHGAGLTLLPKALESWGYTNLDYVEEQKPFDEDFSFAKRPNPEELDALKLGNEKLLKEEKDLFIATDPDADRIGIVVNHKDAAIRLTGNQVACICAKYLLDTLQLKESSLFIKTIVTTELFAKMVLEAGFKPIDVLTGFKYIAQKIEENPSNFVFGAEESCGYLYGTHARDKDAVITACLIAEISLFLQKQGKTLIDYLNEIYKQYGVFRESLVSLSFPDTQEGMETMTNIMSRLREKHPEKIDLQKIVCVEDYLTQEKFKNGKKEKLTLPKSNVLRYLLEDDTKIVIRPSGTEPKIKVYFGAFVPYENDLDLSINKCDQKLKHLNEVVNNLIFNGA